MSAGLKYLQDSVRAECADLRSRIRSLNAVLDDNDQNPELSEAHVELMVTQRDLMASYIDILDLRIEEMDKYLIEHEG